MSLDCASPAFLYLSVIGLYPEPKTFQCAAYNIFCRSWSAYTHFSFCFMYCSSFHKLLIQKELLNAFILRHAFSGQSVSMLVGGWLDPGCLLWMKKQPLCPQWLCFPLRMTQRSGLQRKLQSVDTIYCPHRGRKSPYIQDKSVKTFLHLV